MRTRKTDKIALLLQTSVQPASKDEPQKDVCDETKGRSSKDAFDIPLEDINRHLADREKNETPYMTACESHYHDLVRLYVLADRLHDLTTANLVMDEFLHATFSVEYNPSDVVVNSVYKSTTHGNPLRRLLRDICVHDTHKASYLEHYDPTFHEDFSRDDLMGFIRNPGDFEEECHGECSHVYAIATKMCADNCHYHQHDSTHPRCVPKDEITPCIGEG